jgi:hypothetical protein
MVQERFGSQKSFIRNGIRAVPIPPRFPAIEEGVLQLADGMCLKSFCVLKELLDFFERLGKPRGLITGRRLGPASKLSAEYRKFTADAHLYISTTFSVILSKK